MIGKTGTIFENSEKYFKSANNFWICEQALKVRTIFEITCSQMKSSGLPRHPTLNMVFSEHSWNDPNSCKQVCMLACLQNLELFGGCSTNGGSGRLEGFVESTLFFDIPETTLIFFLWPRTTKSRHNNKLFLFLFCFVFSIVFQSKKLINDRTCHNLYTVSKIIQTWHGCLPWRCPPSCKSWSDLKNVQR